MNTKQIKLSFAGDDNTNIHNVDEVNEWVAKWVAGIPVEFKVVGRDYHGFPVYEFSGDERAIERVCKRYANDSGEDVEFYLSGEGAESGVLNPIV